jgi:hypothetical protein
MKERNANLSLSRRTSMRDQSVCSRVFAGNKSFNQGFFKHSYANLYQ